MAFSIRYFHNGSNGSNFICWRNSGFRAYWVPGVADLEFLFVDHQHQDQDLVQFPWKSPTCKFSVETRTVSRRSLAKVLYPFVLMAKVHLIGIYVRYPSLLVPARVNDTHRTYSSRGNNSWRSIQEEVNTHQGCVANEGVIRSRFAKLSISCQLIFRRRLLINGCLKRFNAARI